MGRFKDVATCLDCGRRRTVRHREWIKAARPRCLECGGPIEISQQAAGEHVAHEDAGRAMQVKETKQAGGTTKRVIT